MIFCWPLLIAPRGYINYWHDHFKTLNNCIFSVRWLLVWWFMRNNFLILFILKVSQKKNKFFSKKKKIQRFDSWVAVTNPFHIPTHKKPLKKKKIEHFTLSLSLYTPLSISFSLSHSLLKCISYAQFWNNFSLFGWKFRNMASLRQNFPVQFLQMTPPALNLSTQDAPNASNQISLVRSPWILNFCCCCYPNLFANE